MKTLKTLASLLVFGALLSGTAHAEQTMDAHEADRTTTKIRQVTYKCATGGTVKVNYGFNKQKLPTYAQVHLGGKTRFLPINLAHSDLAGTFFGDENSWRIGAGALTLGNYHKSDVLIQDPDSNITYKTCKVTHTKKVKG